jgi:acyl-CoA thioester hydrolase
LTIEYFAPARFDDLLEVFVRLSRIGRSTAVHEFAAYRMDEDRLMVTARETLVLVDLGEQRSREIPSGYRERIRAFEGDDLELATPQ